jgi:mRNA interferase MazF
VKSSDSAGEEGETSSFLRPLGAGSKKSRKRNFTGVCSRATSALVWKISKSQKNLKLQTWRDGMNIRRGEIYLAALDPTVGSEIAKTRPTVVISNDINNLYAATVTIVPLTSKAVEEVYPYEVFIPKGKAGLPKDSKVKANQIRTIDKRRLIKCLGMLDDRLVCSIEEAIKIHLNLP